MSVTSNAALDPDALEVAPGVAREHIEGWVPALASDDDLRAALEKAFDYRGDVTITRRDRTQVEGYLFDRRGGKTLSESAVRVISKETGNKVTILYSEIAGLAFTGRDTAAGKSWEAWVRKHQEKKAAGEARIALEPEALD